MRGAARVLAQLASRPAYDERMRGLTGKHREGKQLGAPHAAWMMAMVAALGGCAAKPPPPTHAAVRAPTTQVDSCAAAAPLLARAQSLEAEGRLLRAGRVLDHVPSPCRSERVAAVRAALDAAVRIAGDGVEVERLAERAKSAGDSVAAHRFFDRASLLLEKEQGAPVHVEAFDPTPVRDVAWADDGHSLAVLVRDSVLLADDNGRRTRIPTTGSARVSRLTADALTLTDAESRVTWDLASGKVRERATLEPGVQWSKDGSRRLEGDVLVVGKAPPVRLLASEHESLLGATLEGPEPVYVTSSTSTTRGVELRQVVGRDDGQLFTRRVRIPVERAVQHVTLRRVGARGVVSRELATLPCRSQGQAIPADTEARAQGGGSRPSEAPAGELQTGVLPVDCDQISAATFSADGSVLVLQREIVRSQSSETRLDVTDLRSGKSRHIVVGEAAQRVVVARDGHAILFETDQHGVRTWHAYDLTPAAATLAWERAGLPSFCPVELSYDGMSIAWAAPSGVRIVSAKTGQETRRVGARELLGGEDATCAAGIFRFPIDLCDGVMPDLSAGEASEP